MKNIDKFKKQIKEKCKIVEHIDYHKFSKYYLIHIYFKLDKIVKYLYKPNTFRYNSKIPIGRVYNDYLLTTKELLTKLDMIIEKLNKLEYFYENKM